MEINSILTLSSIDDTGQEVSYKIELYKGRNHGNIGCRRTGDQPLGLQITDPNQLFTIYVPGLAGIPQKEELRSKAIIRKGVASGDANLYLRNIIYYIKEDDKLIELNRKLNFVFPNVQIEVSFDIDNDINISVDVNTDSVTVPLELVGTGVLQAIQILAYITYFNPRLLLLDEPDSHLQSE